MWVLGQWFSPQMVDRINAEVKADPALSRRQLSRRVCEWLGWRGPGGKLQDVSCRVALGELERRQFVSLPALRPIAAFSRGRRTKAQGPKAKPLAIRCSLETLGPVEVVPVSSRYAADSKTWKALMDDFHYLGSGPLCGAQIRYLIRSEAHGTLGGLSFGAATRQLKAREEWIGWSERARQANRHLVVCNTRFLICPGVEVPNLASHVLRLVLGRLQQDWVERYGYAPVLVETFVDGARFEGTCYRAANWVHVGQTAGRADGFKNGTKSSGKKEIFVFPLKRTAKEVLCKEPVDDLVLVGPSPETEDWAVTEFGRARVFDGRLHDRLYTVARDFFAQPGAPVPKACGGNVSKTKAAYRLFDNARLDMQALLKGHVEATVQRASEHPVVLAPQDTTFLNYTAHPETQGLGPINTKADGSIGLVVHDTAAFTPDGLPLGLLDVQCWARDPAEAGKRETRRKRPIEEKESRKWLESYRAVAQAQRLCPDTTFVCMGDRESDLHELFHEAKTTAAGPRLLIRADRARQRKVGSEPDLPGDEAELLWDRMTKEPLAGTLEVKVPRRTSRPARDAKLEMRFASLSLSPPRDKKLEPVALWAVFAKEVDAGPDVKEPIEWMLLTTVPTESFEQAVERVQWYTRRWGIEIYHRVIKSGCRIESRQLCSADRIENCLAVDLVVAWRIHWLTHLGRQTPDVSCEAFLQQEEWQALCAVVTGKEPPSKPPTLREAIRMIATLGGFLGRKGDGEPGTTTLWRGIERLDGIVVGFTAALRLLRARAGPEP